MDALAARTVSVRTNGTDAYGKVAWSWPPDAEAKRAERSARDRGKKARSLGRARRKPLKPLRREGRAIRLRPVVPAAGFFCCRRAMGISRYPAFPAPSRFQRDSLMHHSGIHAARRPTHV